MKISASKVSKVYIQLCGVSTITQVVLLALAYLKAQVEPQIRLAKIERLAWVQDGGVDGWVIRTALWWKLVDHPIIGQAGTAARPYLASVRSKTESG